MGDTQDKKIKSAHQRWAEFRFGVVGGMLSAPPPKGELANEVRRLSEKTWQHPISGEKKGFSRSTIERWYGSALRKENKSPLEVLQRKVRSDLGSHPGIPEAAAVLLRAQYGLYPHWSPRLHRDNLRAEFQKTKPGVAAPSLSTVKRFLRASGMKRQKRPRTRDDGTPLPGALAAAARPLEREVRGYEHEYVGGLWHLDFHVCSRKVLTEDGVFVTPHVLGIIDDHSRLIAHLQWYLSESTENLVHGFSQAIMRRRLPRSLMSDNGSAMKADEFLSGLSRLGIVHEPTLQYSPYQNGKQEAFWTTLEGRLIAMLSRVKDLTLKRLNDLTIAWVEHDYNASFHEEIKAIPRQRYAEDKSVLRASPSSSELQSAFRCEVTRHQRQSDGTVTIEGRRFEIPSQFRHWRKLHLRYASWDFTLVSIVDPRTGTELSRIYPQDKEKNASGIRKRHIPLGEPTPPTAEEREAAPELPPLLESCLRKQELLGLPPAYLPKTNEQKEITIKHPGNNSTESGEK